MNKELEALEMGIVEFEKELEDDCNNEWLKRVVTGMKKCYQRLEAIDQAQLQRSALLKIQTILDSWKTSKIIDDETALKHIENVIKEVVVK